MKSEGYQLRDGSGGDAASRLTEGLPDFRDSLVGNLSGSRIDESPIDCGELEHKGH